MKTTKIAVTTVGTALASAALLIPAAPSFADTSTPAATAKGCSTGELPAAVLGSPKVKAHQAKGVYLWHGPHGYSLRVTEQTSKRLVVTGTISVSGDISHVRSVRTEKNDSVSVHGKTLTFRFVNDGGIDGVNFAAECSATVKVALRSDGEPMAPEAVFLGSHRQHPTSVPFTIERAREGSAAVIG